jgi:hypothetical protein
MSVVGECAAIEKDVDIVLNFLTDIGSGVSQFPPYWFDRNLAESAAFYASLASLGALVFLVAVLFFVPRVRAKWAAMKRSTQGGYDALVEMDSSSMLSMSPKQQVSRRDVQCENLG